MGCGKSQQQGLNRTFGLEFVAAKKICPQPTLQWFSRHSPPSALNLHFWHFIHSHNPQPKSVTIESMTAVSPDARLPGLHAEVGDPHTRLSQALANLEGADWGLLMASEAALAQQLAALLGPGTLRIDARLPLSREVFASAGLALATVDADWRGARAVWLLEPDERSLKRAKRAEVPVLVDGTLAPGGGWLGREAAYIVYRDAATLCGFGDVELAALFGSGDAPARAAPAPSDLSLALALRDVASLPLRLARAARTTATLMERFGGAAQEAGPTALLLSPDSAATSHQPLGGVLAAARNVGAGTLITPGVQGLDAVLALLRGEPSASQPATQQSEAPVAVQPAPNQPAPVPAPQPTEPLPYVPEIIYSDSRPQPEREERREVAPEHRPADIQAREASPEQPPEQTMSPEFQSEAAPSREREPRESQPGRNGRRPDRSSRSGRQAVQPVPDMQAPDVQAETASEPVQPSQAQPPQAQAPQAQPPQPEILLTPDLPPAAGADPAEGLDEQQRATYARLRDWRNAEAKRQEISRFIIASNATLAEIARTAPSDDTELRQVRGMGPERVRKYGEAILGTVQPD